MTETTTARIDSRRARLRSDIRLAARVLPTHYPLGTFIAVNPLAGLQSMPFEQAIRRSGDLYGTPGTLPESTFRTLHHQGRITDTDVDTALARRYPLLADEPDVHLADRRLTAIELLRADLLHGVEAPPPGRQVQTRAEQLSPESPAPSTPRPPNGRPRSSATRAGRCPAERTASTQHGGGWHPATEPCLGRSAPRCAPPPNAPTTPSWTHWTPSGSPRTPGSLTCRLT